MNVASSADKQSEEPPGGGYELIERRLNSVKLILDSETVSDEQRAAAWHYLQVLKKRNRIGEMWAFLCALGAGAASASYFAMLREDAVVEEGDILLPLCIGMVVTAASWYMYRHDTTEYCIDYQYNPDSKKTAPQKIMWSGVVLSTIFLVMIELVLSGYGIVECVKDWENEDLEIALVILLCMSAAVAEAAQTYKYTKKLSRFKEEFNLKALKQIDGNRRNEAYAFFTLYLMASIVTASFTGMVAYEFLENQIEDAAVAVVILYVLLGIPYFWKKSEEQVCEDYAKPAALEQKTSQAASSSWVFYGARAGNVLGEIAFALFGFYEFLKTLEAVDTPQDMLDSYSILCGAAIVMCAAAGSSWVMTAGALRPSYGDKIGEIENQVLQSQSKVSFSSAVSDVEFKKFDQPMSRQLSI